MFSFKAGKQHCKLKESIEPGLNANPEELQCIPLFLNVEYHRHQVTQRMAYTRRLLIYQYQVIGFRT